MPKNQLFKINPDAIIMNSLLNSFGLSGLTDTRYFTRKNMLENSTIKIIENIHKMHMKYFDKQLFTDENSESISKKKINGSNYRHEYPVPWF